MVAPMSAQFTCTYFYLICVKPGTSKQVSGTRIVERNWIKKE